MASASHEDSILKNTEERGTKWRGGGKGGGTASYTQSRPRSTAAATGQARHMTDAVGGAAQRRGSTRCTLLFPRGGALTTLLPALGWSTRLPPSAIECTVPARNRLQRETTLASPMRWPQNFYYLHAQGFARLKVLTSTINGHL